MAGLLDIMPISRAGQPTYSKVPARPQLKTAQELETGYAPTGSAAMDAYNHQLQEAIGRERYWEQPGAIGRMGPLNMMNPFDLYAQVGAKQEAAYLKGNRNNIVLQDNLLGISQPSYTQDMSGYLGGVNGYQGDVTNYLGQLANRSAIGFNTGQSNEIRGQQMGLLGLLNQGARGEGPSAAQGVLRQGVDENIRSALALAASARGASNPAAQRGARYQAASANQAAAGQAAILRAQEMQAAQQLYTGALQGVRGQDLTQASAVAQTALGSRQLDDAQRLGLLQQRLGLLGEQRGLLGIQQGYAQLAQQGDLARLQAQLQYQAMQDAKWEASQGRRGTGFARQIAPIAGPAIGAVGGLLGGIGQLGGGGQSGGYAAPPPYYLAAP